jgi:hypothetical protein
VNRFYVEPSMTRNERVPGSLNSPRVPWGTVRGFPDYRLTRYRDLYPGTGVAAFVQGEKGVTGLMAGKQAVGDLLIAIIVLVG